MWANSAESAHLGTGIEIHPSSKIAADTLNWSSSPQIRRFSDTIMARGSAGNDRRGCRLTL